VIGARLFKKDIDHGPEPDPGAQPTTPVDGARRSELILAY